MENCVFVVGQLAYVWREVNERYQSGYRPVAMSVTEGMIYHVLMELRQVKPAAPTVHIQEDAVPALGRI